MTPAISIFTCPKSFTGEFEHIQTNAIRSWKALGAQVVLIGDDAGVKEAASDLGCVWGGMIERNAFGTPLLNEVFTRGEFFADTALVAYVNCDIILFDDFLMAVSCCAEDLPHFMMSGQRSNVDVDTKLRFDGAEIADAVYHWLKPRAQLIGAQAMDYFVYHKGDLGYVPPFAIGRYRFDNWLAYRALECGLAFVDATEVVFAVHQNHAMHHAPDEHGLEYNDWLVGQNGGELKRLTDANYRLTTGFKMIEVAHV